MQKNIQVKSVSIKKQGTNEKTGKDWTLYIVKCDDPEMKEFSTFNPDYANSEGQQMNSNFEFNEKYKNWQEVSASQAKENDKHDEIMEGLRGVWKKVDDVEKKIDALGVPRTERLKQGELEEPIRDEFENITNEDIANGDGKVPFPPMSDIPYETQRDDKGTGDDK